jgi:molybdate transport system ATP-binding protein
MLDEPFTALDGESTDSVKILIRTFVTQLEIPCIVVTHRILDISEIADKACVICRGKKQWAGIPNQLPKELCSTP